MTGVARISDSAALRCPRAQPGSRFCAIAHWRTEHGFVREVYTGAQAVIARIGHPSGGCPYVSFGELLTRLGNRNLVEAFRCNGAGCKLLNALERFGRVVPTTA